MDEADQAKERERAKKEAQLYAMKLLSKREYSAAQIHQKLQKKEHTPEIIEEVLAWCREKKYQSDTRFAAAFVRDSIRLKQWGPRKIQQKLYEKGIADHEIQEAIQHEYSEELQQKNKQELTKKFMRNKGLTDTNNYAIKQKLWRFLASRGF